MAVKLFVKERALTIVIILIFIVKVLANYPQRLLKKLKTPFKNNDLFLCVLADSFIYCFQKKLINHKLMLRVVLGRVSTTEFNELQSEQCFNRNHSFCNQALSPFQILVIIKSWFNIICFTWSMELFVQWNGYIKIVGIFWKGIFYIFYRGVVIFLKL